MKFALLWLVLFMATLPVTQAADSIRFGALPSLVSYRIDSEYAPLTSTLEDYFQQPVVIRTRSSYSMYSEALRNEEFDLALVQPFDYIQLRKSVDYLPIVRLRTPLSALIVVNDETLQSIADLSGQVVGFPPETAAVSILGIESLARNGLAPTAYRKQLFREHESCLQALIVRSVYACVTAPEILDVVKKDKNQDFHILLRSPSIPNVLLIAHQRFQSHRKTLAQYLISESNDTESRLYTQTDSLRFVAASDNDYDVVEDIYKNLQTPDP